MKLKFSRKSINIVFFLIYVTELKFRLWRQLFDLKDYFRIGGDIQKIEEMVYRPLSPLGIYKNSKYITIVYVYPFTCFHT